MGYTSLRDEADNIIEIHPVGKRSISDTKVLERISHKILKSFDQQLSVKERSDFQQIHWPINAQR